MHMGRDHSSPGMEIQGQDGSMSRVRVSKDGNVVGLTSVLVQQQLVFSLFNWPSCQKYSTITNSFCSHCPYKSGLVSSPQSSSSTSSGRKPLAQVFYRPNALPVTISLYPQKITTVDRQSINTTDQASAISWFITCTQQGMTILHHILGHSAQWPSCCSMSKSASSKASIPSKQLNSYYCHLSCLLLGP